MLTTAVDGGVSLLTDSPCVRLDVNSKSSCHACRTADVSIHRSFPSSNSFNTNIADLRSDEITR